MRLLVHLHVYYHEQVDYFIKKLSNISGCDWDLYVTYVEENEVTQNKIKTLKPDAVFMKVENLGYDVLPFLLVIRSINLDDYDYVMKLHTKSYAKQKIKLVAFKAKLKGYYWRNRLVEPLIGTKRRFSANIDKLKCDNSIGFIASRLLYLRILGCCPEETFLLEQLKNRLNLDYKADYFIAGTMFIIKSDILKKIANSDLNQKDFCKESETGEEGTIAHTLERIFPMIVFECGYKVIFIKDIFYLQYLLKCVIKNIFGLRNSLDKKHKVITILGFKIKIKRGI